MCVSLCRLEIGIKGAGPHGLECGRTKRKWGFCVLLKRRGPCSLCGAAHYEASQRQTVVHFPPGWGSPQITHHIQCRKIVTVQHLQDTPLDQPSQGWKSLLILTLIIVSPCSPLRYSVTSISVQFQRWLQSSEFWPFDNRRVGGRRTTTPPRTTRRWPFTLHVDSLSMIHTHPNWLQTEDVRGFVHNFSSNVSGRGEHAVCPSQDSLQNQRVTTKHVKCI